jgi:hypothetical protein
MTTLQDVIRRVRVAESQNIYGFVVEIVKNEDCRNPKKLEKTIKKYFNCDVHGNYDISSVSRDGVTHMHFYRR